MDTEYSKLFNQEYMFGGCECFHDERWMESCKSREKLHANDCSRIYEFEKHLVSDPLLQKFLDDTVKAQALIVWGYDSAPSIIQELTANGGDEDYIVWQPNKIADQDFYRIMNHLGSHEDNKVSYSTSIGVFTVGLH